MMSTLLEIFDSTLAPCALASNFQKSRASFVLISGLGFSVTRACYDVVDSDQADIPPTLNLMYSYLGPTSSLL